MSAEQGEGDVWQRYARNVKRINRKKATLGKSKPITKKKVERIAITEPPKEAPPIVSAPRPEVRLDRRVEKNLRSGEIKIDAKFDMHGMRQQEAFVALQKFVLTQADRGKRNLLVITGKGNPGILRANLPRWCEQAPLASLILALRPAAARHGGDGAWYVMLRKYSKDT